jgi:hypothetical protein
MGSVTVTIDDEHLSVIADVADALRSSGMRVDQVLAAAGVVTGAVPDGREGQLRSVEGVASVDSAQQVQLPPPGAPVQ